MKAIFAALFFFLSALAFAEHPFNACPKTVEECREISPLRSVLDGASHALRIAGRLGQSYGANVDSCYFSEKGDSLKSDVRYYLRGQELDVAIWIACSKISDSCDPEKENCEWRDVKKTLVCSEDRYRDFLKWKDQVREQWMPMRINLALGFKVDYGAVYDLGNELKPMGHPEEDNPISNPAPLPPLSSVETQTVITETLRSLGLKAKETCTDDDYVAWASQHKELQPTRQKIKQFRCERRVSGTSLMETKIITSPNLLTAFANWKCNEVIESDGVWTYPRDLRANRDEVKFASCLTRKQIGDYASKEKVPKTMAGLKNLLPKLLPAVDAFPDKTPEEEARLSGVTAILPNAFNGGVLDPVQGPRALDLIKREAQDSYFNIINSNYLMAFIDTENPSNTDMRRALERSFKSIQKQVDETYKTGPLSMKDWDYLQYTGVANEFLRNRPECCQFAVEKWEAMNVADKSRKAILTAASVATNVGCISASGIITPPGAIACAVAASAFYSGIDWAITQKRSQRLKDIALTSLNYNDLKGLRQLKGLDKANEDKFWAGLAFATSPVFETFFSTKAALAVTRALRAEQASVGLAKLQQVTNGVTPRVSQTITRVPSAAVEIEPQKALANAAQNLSRLNTNSKFLADLGFIPDPKSPTGILIYRHKNGNEILLPSRGTLTFSSEAERQSLMSVLRNTQSRYIHPQTRTKIADEIIATLQKGDESSLLTNLSRLEVEETVTATDLQIFRTNSGQEIVLPRGKINFTANEKIKLQQSLTGTTGYVHPSVPRELQRSRSAEWIASEIQSGAPNPNIRSTIRSLDFTDVTPPRSTDLIIYSHPDGGRIILLKDPKALSQVDETRLIESLKSGSKDFFDPRLSRTRLGQLSAQRSVREIQEPPTGMELHKLGTLPKGSFFGPKDFGLRRITRTQFEKLPEGTVLYDLDGAKRVVGRDIFDVDTKGQYLNYGFRYDSTEAEILGHHRFLIQAGYEDHSETAELGLMIFRKDGKEIVLPKDVTKLTSTDTARLRTAVREGQPFTPSNAREIAADTRVGYVLSATNDLARGDAVQVLNRLGFRWDQNSPPGVSRFVNDNNALIILPGDQRNPMRDIIFSKAEKENLEKVLHMRRGNFVHPAVPESLQQGREAAANKFVADLERFPIATLEEELNRLGFTKAPGAEPGFIIYANPRGGRIILPLNEPKLSLRHHEAANLQRVIQNEKGNFEYVPRKEVPRTDEVSRQLDQSLDRISASLRAKALEKDKPEALRLARQNRTRLTTDPSYLARLGYQLKPDPPPTQVIFVHEISGSELILPKTANAFDALPMNEEFEFWKIVQAGKGRYMHPEARPSRPLLPPSSRPDNLQRRVNTIIATGNSRNFGQEKVVQYLAMNISKSQRLDFREGSILVSGKSVVEKDRLTVAISHVDFNYSPDAKMISAGVPNGADLTLAKIMYGILKGAKQALITNPGIKTIEIKGEEIVNLNLKRSLTNMGFISQETGASATEESLRYKQTLVLKIPVEKLNELLD